MGLPGPLRADSEAPAWPQGAMLRAMTSPDVPQDAREFRRHLEESPARAAEYTREVHPADTALWLLDLDLDEAFSVFAELDTEHQAELLEYAEDDLTAELVSRMSAQGPSWTGTSRGPRASSGACRG